MQSLEEYTFIKEKPSESWPGPAFEDLIRYQSGTLQDANAWFVPKVVPLASNVVSNPFKSVCLNFCHCTGLWTGQHLQVHI